MQSENDINPKLPSLQKMLSSSSFKSSLCETFCEDEKRKHVNEIPLLILGHQSGTKNISESKNRKKMKCGQFCRCGEHSRTFRKHHADTKMEPKAQFVCVSYRASLIREASEKRFFMFCYVNFDDCKFFFSPQQN